MRTRARAEVDAAVLPTRFRASEVERIDRAQTILGLPSRSAFIHSAVMGKVAAIEETKIIEVREVTEEEAMRMISRYLRKHPGVHYTSEIADELGIDLPVAFAATERLIEQGRAHVRGD